MIFYCDQSLVTCAVVIREASSSSRWEHMRRSTVKTLCEQSLNWSPLDFREFHGRGGGKPVGVRGARGHQENMTHQINQAGHIWFTETEASTGPTGICTWSSAYMLWRLVCCSSGTPNCGVGVSLTLWAALRTIYLFPLGLPCLD